MTPTIALLGNPNVGKTAIFNALTGLSQTTANYAGVTVSRKYGEVRVNKTVARLVDLPGAYSLAARSPDEIIVADVLLGQQRDEEPIDGLLVVLDASNLERNLYFLSQLMELELPTLVALNMTDVARRREIKVDADALSEALGVPVVPTCAATGKGIDTLRTRFERLVRGEILPVSPVCQFPEREHEAIKQVCSELSRHEDKIGRSVPLLEAVRLLVDEGGEAEKRLTRQLGNDFPTKLREIRAAAWDPKEPLAVQEAQARYAWARSVLERCVTRPAKRVRPRSERLDDLLTHRIWGTLTFVLAMLFLFQSIYSWATPAMDFIDGGVGALGDLLGGILPDGTLRSLVVDGIVAGVGGVVIFLPQILMLSLFIALLEDCGYMARAAFVMDKLLSWCGLSGQSFIPMLTSFACAVPGIISTRTIGDYRDRMTTILVAPLMSCSARLPVYVIMIAAFVPHQPLLGGLFNTQGTMLFLMYLLGIAVAAPVAWLLKRTVFKGPTPPLLLEMPSYKVPQAGTVVRKVYREGREFLVRAGTLIFAVSILVWALAYFPRSASIVEDFDARRAAAETSIADEAEREEVLAHLDEEEAGEHLRNSLLGRMGHAIEPLFMPLGWDWRIATATIASFPAREIIVATLGTLFNLGADEDEESTSLRETLRAAIWPDGRPLFTLPVALSIMVFFALCAQCAATLMTIYRETGEARWPLLAFTYMTGLAYVGALLTYQLGTALLS
ncbi:MAG: ferrous iron transport protein [Candidatus Hydrogenedentota bacterium]|jgi:ferrous iron transport protein B